jgi:hypothetical protein
MRASETTLAIWTSEIVPNGHPDRQYLLENVGEQLPVQRDAPKHPATDQANGVSVAHMIRLFRYAETSSPG